MLYALAFLLLAVVGQPPATPQASTAVNDPRLLMASHDDHSHDRVPTAKPTLRSPTKNKYLTYPPTSRPTLPTTGLPTSRPTLRPTSFPTTPLPTSSSTGLPTSRPTLPPTSFPTPLPTSLPSGLPAPPPTHPPTPLPTSSPTGLPTPPPTFPPTGFPTPLPTSSPTPPPTPPPSHPPTPLPTSSPTGLPTSQPTLRPTSFPSPLPTSSPTSLPTPPPTLRPTGLPTPLQRSSSLCLATSSSLTPPPTPPPTLRPTGLPTPLPTSSSLGLATSSLTSPPTLPPTGLPTPLQRSSSLGLATSSSLTPPPTPPPTLSPSTATQPFTSCPHTTCNDAIQFTFNSTGNFSRVFDDFCVVNAVPVALNNVCGLTTPVQAIFINLFFTIPCTASVTVSGASFTPQLYVIAPTSFSGCAGTCTTLSSSEIRAGGGGATVSFVTTNFLHEVVMIPGAGTPSPFTLNAACKFPLQKSSSLGLATSSLTSPTTPPSTLSPATTTQPSTSCPHTTCDDAYVFSFHPTGNFSGTLNASCISNAVPVALNNVCSLSTPVQAIFINLFFTMPCNASVTVSGASFTPQLYVIAPTSFSGCSDGTCTTLSSSEISAKGGGATVSFVTTNFLHEVVMIPGAGTPSPFTLNAACND